MKKSAITFLSFAVLAIAASSCGSKWNKLKFKDPNADNKDVYGVKGGEPIQLSGKYTPDATVAELSKAATPKFREQVEASVAR